MILCGFLTPSLLKKRGKKYKLINKRRLYQEGNTLKSLEKRIFLPPGALLAPVTVLVHTKAFCALTPNRQLLLEMGNLLSWLMVAVSI